MITKIERAVREQMKANHRRALAGSNWGHKDLLEIFGLGVANRLRTLHSHEKVGKNYFSNHFHAGAHNPTGSKLLRRFIRESNGEQVTVRRAYAALTGRQYDHLNNPDHTA